MAIASSLMDDDDNSRMYEIVCMRSYVLDRISMSRSTPNGYSLFSLLNWYGDVMSSSSFFFLPQPP